MKTQRIIMSAFMLFVLSITACNNQPNQSQEDSSNTPSLSSEDSNSSEQAQHTHVWSSAWSGNETHHWHICRGFVNGESCQELDSYGEHTWNNGEAVIPAGALTPGRMKYSFLE